MYIRNETTGIIEPWNQAQRESEHGRIKERKGSMNFLFVDRLVSHADSSEDGRKIEIRRKGVGGKDKGIAY